ncbi:RNA polymerase sigma factor [Thalassospira sp. MA62]|nr:RNA polymerase sigma factor [Thalassospira sp. MA62]
MQNEKNIRQDEASLSKAEQQFANNLEQALGLAMGSSDNVTQIWSHLHPDQRARIADGYLEKLTGENAPRPTGQSTEQRPSQSESDHLTARDAPDTWDSSQIPKNGATSSHDPSQTESDIWSRSPLTPPAAAQPAPTPPNGPPRGYPANFNPLAGFPGLEPSRNAPRPEDIIAGSLPGFGPSAGASPLDILGGLLPGSVPTPGPAPTIDPQSWPTHTNPPTPPSPEDLVPQQAPAPTADPGTTEPEAPNFWPLWIDQQDILLKQCLKLMSGNMDDAQDALSEAMVKASTKFEDSMDEIRNHRAWLSRIVHNSCIDLHRQNRRKAEYREETHGATESPVSPMTAPNIPDPEESFLASEKLDQLEDALQSMQEKLRKPLLMRCLQDRSYDEIADALGLSNCAVRKRVQLAREHLRGAGID